MRYINKAALPLCVCVSDLLLCVFSLQKLAVRACPVGGAKPLALTRPPGPGLAISVVTPHLNGQRVELVPPQAPPTNLQTGAITFASRRAVELPPPQVTCDIITLLAGGASHTPTNQGMEWD